MSNEKKSEATWRLNGGNERARVMIHWMTVTDDPLSRNCSSAIERAAPRSRSNDYRWNLETSCKAPDFEEAEGCSPASLIDVSAPPECADLSCPSKVLSAFPDSFVGSWRLSSRRQPDFSLSSRCHHLAENPRSPRKNFCCSASRGRYSE